MIIAVGKEKGLPGIQLWLVSVLNLVPKKQLIRAKILVNYILIIK